MLRSFSRDGRRQNGYETLINIARASRRLYTGLARENSHLQLVSARTRLDKIVVASKSILAKSLSNESFLDPRLGDWLSSKEPDMCLHILSDMERLIAPDTGTSGRTIWGKVSRAVYPMYTEGKINEAIKLFNDRQDFFHFLLTPEVWNCEYGIPPQPGTVPDVVPKDTNKPSCEEQTAERVDKRKLHSVLKWLGRFDFKQKHQSVVSLRQPETCTWLPETEQFKVWRNSDDAFLWLQGKAGAGKTVLAASVIEKIKETLQDGEFIIFFYCDFKDERTMNAAAVMGSMLSQLLDRLWDGTGRDLIQLIDDIVNGITEGTLVLNHARSITPFVSRAASQFNRQPVVVIDALDECQDVESLLHALLELAKGGMRLFVTSRPLQIIKDKFHALPCISMDRMAKEVSADIGLHVVREIDGHRRLRILEEKMKTEILHTLRNKVDGMFRWVQCQIDVLKKCATVKDVRTALYSLPSGLNETYERILCAIDFQSSDGKVARRALVWLVAALRPLTLVEILVALSIDLQGRRLDHEIAPVHGHALLDALGSLVVYNEETDVIHLSHFTVKEYLLGTSSPTKLSMYHIDLDIAHAQVALLCMCYVAAVIKLERGTLSETETGLQVLSDWRSDVAVSKLHPLLCYAFSHGFRHLLYLGSGNRTVIDGMIGLRLDIERHPAGWRLMGRLASRCLKLLSRLSAQHDFIICVLVSLLSPQFLLAFLRRAPFKASDGTSPLVYATYFNKIEHARTLLSYRVSHVNTTGLDVERPCQVLPLEVAFHYQHHSLFDLFLLDWRATVPSQLFFSVLREQHLEHTPRDATMLLQSDEFAEWMTDGQHGQSLLHALNHCDWGKIMRSVSEKDVLALLRRCVQVGCDLSSPDVLEALLAISLVAASQRPPQVTMLQCLCTLDAPIPSRVLLAGRAMLVRELTLRSLDLETIMTRGDAVFHRAFGECKRGSSCWAPDCNLCSVFLRVIDPQLHVLLHVLFVGRTGAGKSSLINMVLGVPDDTPGAAQVASGFDGSTSQTTSYATLLESLPVQIWDTPGFDKALDTLHVRAKIDDWLLQVSSSHCNENSETTSHPNELAPIEIVWCMDAADINDPIVWQQIWAIYEECHRREVISKIVINQVPTQSPSDWEVQCENQLQALGLSAGSEPVLLKSVRSHQGVTSSEYKDDSVALSRLIRRQALQHLTLGHRLGHPHEVRILTSHPGGSSDLNFRCRWVTIHPRAEICNCLIRQSDILEHLILCHGIRTLSSVSAVLTCQWKDCGKIISRKNFLRHIRNVHVDPSDQRHNN